MTVSSSASAVSKVIVAVHGIGDQTEFATIQNVFARFCDYHGSNAAAPLGYFHNAQAYLSTLSDYPASMHNLAFTEVYWANLPRQIVSEGFTLEAAQGWAQSIVARLRLRWLRGACGLPMTDDDFPMVEQVLKEGLQTLKALDGLCYLSDKLGLFKFDLNKVMLDYLDDVQIVADFRAQSDEIVKRFSDKLAAIHAAAPDAEVYLVTHSEGTVVALLGLLKAMGGANKPAWLDQVRGWMTLGSPIDKHLKLWPELFNGYETPLHSPKQKILWRNYYDLGDPIGFELDEARVRFTAAPWQAFEFAEGKDDMGFSRYPLPGAAHNEYWKDNDVFGHFIKNAVYRGEDVKPLGRQAEKRTVRYDHAPKTRHWVPWVSNVLPYVALLVLLFAGVYTLYQALTGMEGGTAPASHCVALSVCVGVTLLLAGLTTFARLVRLTRSLFWWGLGLLNFAVGIVVYRWLDCQSSPLCCDGCSWRRWLSYDTWQNWCSECLVLDSGAGWGLVSFAVAAAAAAISLSLLAGVLRRPNWGMRTLLLPAGAGLAAFLLFHYPLGLLVSQWKVLLAAAFFFYVWWLVALLFDLVFVWHRYIRRSENWEM